MFFDPVLACLIYTFAPDLAINGQWLTFGFTNLILITLSIMDRNNRKAKWAYPGLLIHYLITEIPIYFSLTSLGWWSNLTLKKT